MAVCRFTAKKNDLFNRLQSVKSREVSCDYSLISDPTARSLMSDKYNMMHFFTTTSTTTTTTTTTTQTSTPEEKPSADLSLVTTPPSTATEEPTAASPVFSTPLITTRHTATRKFTV
ncbi:salivary glue protein Sgs-3 [Ictalurus punctatus]|uniref:Salivary glue protein Sgs-3 n=1 Tax=Ictalurus punctatus TaxID=7998 RepID=A0A9F7TEI2_ICTPU|nr:salivary glue protein Sgs-3 [Ictalurus punctatus]